jgi:hypothetical protein
LCEVAGYWQELEQAVVYVDPQHPKHSQWVTCLVSMQAMEELDTFSFQELCTDPCDMGLCVIMLKHEMWRQTNGSTMGLRISSQYLCAFKLPSTKCNRVRF